MAITYPKLPLRISEPNNSFESLFERDAPEGVSQTFVAGTPLKAVSGQLAAWVNPTDAALVGYALSPASGVTGAKLRYVMQNPRVELEANLLGSAAADRALVATDLFTSYDLVSGAILPGGVTGWYFAATTVDVAVRICDIKSDYPVTNVNQSFPLVGDINPRVKANLIGSKSLWA
jgi:hypothetical protein